MDPQRAQRGALAAVALGALLLTLAGIDALWQLYVNRDPSTPLGAAFEGSWRVARLMLVAAGGVLILAAAATLWTTRDEVAE